MKHTSGPWSINDWPQDTTDITIGAVLTPLIAKVPLRDVSINEQKANARLIAAAPELLEALQDALGDLEYLKNAPDSAYARPDDETIKTARAAIAKAGGGS